MAANCAVHISDFTKKDCARINFSVFNQRRIHYPEAKPSSTKHSVLQLRFRYTRPPYQNSPLLSRYKNHALTNVCCLKLQGSLDIIRSEVCAVTKIFDQIILVNVVTERICYGFNHSQNIQMYSKQSK